MTAPTLLNVPTGPQQDANVPPVPWRRMAWVTWRQHRIALGGAAAFLGGLALLVWITGDQLHRAAAISCNPSSASCGDLVTHLDAGSNFMIHVLTGGYVLQVVPALIGAFVGAPVLARELETGTFRYAWTQGFGRWRWTLAKLVALGVVVTAAAGAISALFSWYYAPYLATRELRRRALILSEQSPFSRALFDLRGVSFAAWTLVAFAIAVLAGMLIRRVVPAIVATLAVYTGLALVAANILRPHYLTPLLTSSANVPGSAWIYNQWWTRNGVFAFSGIRGAPSSLLAQCASIPTDAIGKPSSATLAQCFAQHGYRELTRYQPVGRFWAFQWIEGGWLLALSALLVAVTIWLVRRRAA